MKVKAGSQDILPQETQFFHLLDGDLQMLHSDRVFLSHVNVAIFCPHGIGTDDHALENSVGIPFQNRPIHKGTWVPLIRVTDNILGLSFCLAGKLPFHTRGKAGTTPSPQFGPGHFLDDLLWRHPGKRPHDSLITAGSNIMLDLSGIDSTAAGQHSPYLFLVKGNLTPVVDGNSRLWLPV